MRSSLSLISVFLLLSGAACSSSKGAEEPSRSSPLQLAGVYDVQQPNGSLGALRFYDDRFSLLLRDGGVVAGTFRYDADDHVLRLTDDVTHRELAWRASAPLAPGATEAQALSPRTASPTDDGAATTTDECDPGALVCGDATLLTHAVSFTCATSGPTDLAPSTLKPATNDVDPVGVLCGLGAFARQGAYDPAPGDVAPGEALPPASSRFAIALLHPPSQGDLWVVDLEDGREVARRPLDEVLRHQNMYACLEDACVLELIGLGELAGWVVTSAAGAWWIQNQSSTQRIGPFASSGAASSALSTARQTNCSERRFWELVNAKEKWCGQPRSCTEQTSCAELRARVAAGSKCVDARTSVMSCYQEPDQEHIDELARARSVLINCQRILGNKQQNGEC